MNITPLTIENLDLPDVPFNVVKIDMPFAKLRRKMFHHCVIIAGIITSNPADLNTHKRANKHGAS